MAYGFFTKNDAGLVQFSTDSPGYYMIASGSEVLPYATPVPDEAWLTKTFATSTTYDMLFVRTASADLWVRPPSLQPTTRTGITLKYANLVNSGTKTVEWWAFRNFRNLTAPSSGMGMNVFNSDGTTSFSSGNHKILKPAGKLALTSAAMGTWTLSSGPTYAFAQYGTLLTPTIFYGPPPNSIERTVGQGVGIYSPASNQVTYQHGLGREGPGSASVYTGGLIAVDVTGY